MIRLNKPRYKLLKGKYGCYFYDSVVNIDLTLDMLLNKLNRLEKIRIQKNYLINEVRRLKDKIVLLNEVNNH